MQTAANVARWFLSRNASNFENEDVECISNLKLQKLLYYAQGCHLALHEIPLFNDDIVAWEHGPVVVSVYQEYKSNKGNGITDFEPPTENFSEEENDLLEFVQKNFGQYSAWKLRNMTHEEMPWKSTKRNCVIPIDCIKEYFKENYLE